MAVVLDMRSRGDSVRPGKPAWPDTADVNVRVLRCLARYVDDEHGHAAIEKLASSVGLTPAALDGESRWISLEQFEAFLDAARLLLGSDEAYAKASVHRYAELAFGPLRFALWATSPRAVYEASFKHVGVVSAISRYEPVEWSTSHVRVRYKSTRAEHRLFCRMRQAMGAAMPTLWGLPPAHLTEGTCIARGDDACEYTLRWYERRRWLPILVGLGVGAGAGAASFYAGLGVPLVAVLPVIGGAVGRIYELSRVNVANIAAGAEIQSALTELARDDAEARQELTELQRRQADWTRLMEQQLHERTAALQDVARRVQSLAEQRISSIRGLSHDLKTPLQVLKSNVEVLRRHLDELPERDRDAVVDLEDGVARMEQMLADLVRTAVDDALLASLSPSYLPIPPLADRFQKMLRALVHGRDVRVTAFATREAPESIVVDEMLFDRVMDNLLTNAAKYTERGSIVVEVTGKPGFLTLKVSDTGRGIAPEEIDGIFQPGGSDAATRATLSHGVGLSVVVQLLDQIGGELEVMSRLGDGTTFWVHFPVEHEAATASSTRARPAVAGDLTTDRLKRVLKVRRTGGA